jgi:phosphotriesterase-related protein
MSESELRTVLGPVPANSVGVTLAHEHCLIDLSTWFEPRREASRTRDISRPVEMGLLAELRRWPFATTRDNLALNDEDLAIEELGAFYRAGGAAVVDVTSIGLGRDPQALQRISRATGLAIVAATGIYIENTHPAWVAEMNADAIADLFVEEVTGGIEDTGVRAGVIGEIGLTGIPKGWGRRKVGPLTDAEEKVLRAAARAATETGAVVSLHIDPVPPRATERALSILLHEENVPPSRVIVGHMDQVHDIDYHLAVAAEGVFVEYDSMGREHYSFEWGYDFNWGHDAWRIRYVEQLIGDGHTDQLLLSQDVCLKTDLRKFGGPGYGHVLTNIVPMLTSIGVESRVVETILVDNPRRAFAIAGPA